ncbi:MAG: alpha/beta hydrolase [Pseudomonadales bacterium]
MIVILHGWSDSEESFRPLARWLTGQDLDTPIQEIRLGDYLTLDDDVTFADLTAALERAWDDVGLSRQARSVDVIVHSTGALVIRDWMSGLQGDNPVRRLLMLAPANFGSPLARLGSSMIGRVFKGFRSERRFHTGTRILKGLEMASPYSVGLAAKDLFGNRSVFAAGGVLCTVLVGVEGYKGIRAVANKPGTDGTVYIATANLNAARLTVDFAADPQQPVYRLTRSNGRAAFARVPGHNHTTITLSEGADDEYLTALIRSALTVTDQTFAAHCARLEAADAQVPPGAGAAAGGGGGPRRLQNTVLHVHDDVDADVDDFFLELFVKKAPGSRSEWEAATTRVQEKVITTAHVYSGNPAYRSLLIDCVELGRTLQTYPGTLCMALTAQPDIAETGSVGYRTFGWNDLDSVKLDTRATERMFTPDRTLLVELKIRREQEADVFRLKTLGRSRR